MAEIIQKRRDTAANFTSANPVLAQGEEAYELDTKKEKIGDGVTAWNGLTYKTNLESLGYTPANELTVQDHETRITALEGSADSTIDHEYVDIPTMIANQNLQLEDDIIKVLDASADPTIGAGKAYYFYDGTIAGTIDDYTLLTKEEVQALTSQQVTTALGYTPADDAEVVKGVLNPDGTEINKDINGKVKLPNTLPNEVKTYSGNSTFSVVDANKLTNVYRNGVLDNNWQVASGTQVEFLGTLVINDEITFSYAGGYGGKNSAEADIDIWGDSLTDQAWNDKLAAITGRNVFKNGFSGKKSHYIRDQFLASLNKDRAQIFWVGRNNYNQIDAVIDDVRTMVEALSHQRFLIMTPPNGGYSYEFEGNTGHTQLKNISDRLQKNYPDNFIDNRNAAIEYYDMGGVTLDSSFTQPSIGNSVQIQVSDATFLNTENSSDAASFPSKSTQIRIGDLYTSDLYTIISLDSPNLLTVRLDESNLFAPAEIVDNEVLDGSIKYLKVIQEMDYYMWQNNTTLSTFRSDSVHMNDTGRGVISKIIARALESKKI